MINCIFIKFWVVIKYKNVLNSNDIVFNVDVFLVVCVCEYIFLSFNNFIVVRVLIKVLMIIKISVRLISMILIMFNYFIFVYKFREYCSI